MIGYAKVLCVAAALSMSGAALAQESGWAISEADGQVSIIRGERAIYGARGTELQVGDVVRTSSAASAVLVRGDDFFVVSADQRVRIKLPQEQGVVEQFFEYVGNLMSSGAGHSQLDRPLGAAVVKGLDGGLGNGLTAPSDTPEEQPVEAPVEAPVQAPAQSASDQSEGKNTNGQSAE